MWHSARLAAAFGAASAAAILIAAPLLQAQASANPYRVNSAWNKPLGRTIGVASGIRMDPDGRHMWILDRCGSNGCAESDLDPIIRMDPAGKIVRTFGKGLINFPHGFFIDREGHVWVTDGAPAGDPRGEAGFKKGMGHQVFKFSPEGKLLMRLGTAGVAGADDTHFNGPTGVVVAANGDTWITDGHGGPQVGPNRDNMYGSRGGNNRLVRFSRDGKFIRAWGGGIGSESADPLRFNDPHDIAIDADGKLYVADRGNQRVQVLDPEGTFVTRWTQFGKPSAIAIDTKGNIYVADGMSDARWNPGWERGIRVGDIKTGWLRAFIPDTEIPRGAGTEFLGVDGEGTIYSGASSRPGIVVHQLYRPLQ